MASEENHVNNGIGHSFPFIDDFTMEIPISSSGISGSSYDKGPD